MPNDRRRTAGVKSIVTVTRGRAAPCDAGASFRSGELYLVLVPSGRPLSSKRRTMSGIPPSRR